jgi:hypothetical protein
MHRISFQNRGLIDVRAIFTFGANVKASDNPIGFFGTGLKYALAVCARLGCRVTLYRGLDKYEFLATPVEIRGKNFDVITLREPDGSQRELGFTTELGKRWEPWQAFRELYCNTLDEGGVITADPVLPAEGMTLFYVDGEPMYRAYCERDKIVLEGEPLHKLAALWVYNTPNLYTYYRNVRVHQLSKPAIHTYSLFGWLELTEDRTAKYNFQVDAAIRDALLASTDKELLRRVLSAPRDSYEATLDFDTMHAPGPTFMQVLEELPFAQVTNQSAILAHRKHAKRVLRPDAVPLDNIEREILRRATEVVEWMGHPLGDYPVVVTTDLKDDTWGLAHDGTIFLNRSAFRHGTKVVAGTILEEHIHLSTGLQDTSRALQNFLLNALVSMAERARGAPL